MNPHAGDATTNKRNSVYTYAGSGLTTCGTAGVAPIRWGSVSASEALMPFMLATCPHKCTRGIRAGAAPHHRETGGIASLEV